MIEKTISECEFECKAEKVRFEIYMKFILFASENIYFSFFNRFWLEFDSILVLILFGFLCKFNRIEHVQIGESCLVKQHADTDSKRHTKCDRHFHCIENRWILFFRFVCAVRRSTFESFDSFESSDKSHVSVNPLCVEWCVVCNLINDQMLCQFKHIQSTLTILRFVLFILISMFFFVAISSFFASLFFYRSFLLSITLHFVEWFGNFNRCSSVHYFRSSDELVCCFFSVVRMHRSHFVIVVFVLFFLLLTRIFFVFRALKSMRCDQ